MSYDLMLYEREFLRVAASAARVDWSTAPPLPESAVASLVARVTSAGFVERLLDPGFIDFARAQGHIAGREFYSPGDIAQFTLFGSSASFSIRAGDPSSLSTLASCAQVAKGAARELGLGFYDPQTGELDA